MSAAERRTTTHLPLPSAPRLLMGSARSPGALVDGGWWPRSADPVAELPGLVLALQGYGPPGEHGPITHIMLRVSDWDGRPHRLRVEGVEGLTDTRMVRLNWFDGLPAGLLTAISADGHRVDLLTVPPGTDEKTAWAAMGLAVDTGDPDVLASARAQTTPAPRTGTETVEEGRWESEGGQ